MTAMTAQPGILPATITASIGTPIITAVEAVREQFVGHPMSVDLDDTGGVYVIVEDIDLGSAFTPSTTWLGFQISAAYPAADVYPHYLGVVARADGQPLGQAVQPVDWRNKPCLQLSRRSPGWNPSRDNAALKAEKVLAWFTEQ